MKVERVSSVLRASVVSLLVVGALATLGGLGVLLLHTSRGASPVTAFTDVPAGAQALSGVVVWNPDSPLQGRPVEPTTRRAVTAAWTRAWEALQGAAEGDGSLLATWFTGGALSQVQAGLGSREVPTGLELGKHHLTVTFYSDDGAVVGLRADPVSVTRTTVAGGLVHRVPSLEAYDVALVLEDGNWRIRLWERVEPSRS